MLSEDIAECCQSINNNINNSTQLIINTINACCATLEEEIALLSACGPIIPIFQKDIPLRIVESGHYCLAEDVVVNSVPLSKTALKASSASFLASFGIAIRATNVDLNLNNHKMTVLGGSGVSAIVTLGTSSHISIHDGIIVGSGNVNDQNCAGIQILTSNVIVSDVQIQNFAGLNSAGIVIEGLNVADPSAEGIIRFGLQGVMIQRCNLSGNIPAGLLGNYAGITFGNHCTNVIIQDCSIDGSLFAGINEPARNGYSSNILIKNSAISNSTYHGIFSTFNQSNWIFDHVQITNSGLDGAIFTGFQTLSLNQCQVFNSGSYGITATIRQNQNVELNNCQIFNAANAALRIDNTSNILLNNCQFTNYISSPEPVVKLQDIYSGSVTRCHVISAAGSSDGIFLRNCHGLSVANCNVNILCNQPQTSCPVGINLQGAVTTTVVKECIVSGNPSIGIAIQPDARAAANPAISSNTGVSVKNCTIEAAVLQGILVAQSSACSILDNEISNGQGTGIFLDLHTSNCPVRNNTLTNNVVSGITNNGTNNQIYHNFASGNGSNYTGVNLVVAPAPMIGVLENISG